MSVINNVVSSPIDIEEVRTLIGENINCRDLKNLCTSNKINIWAKYRPFLANNSQGCLGLTNSSISGNVDFNSSSFNSAVTLNYYGNSGTLDNDPDYRYDISVALGFADLNNNNQIGVSPVYFKSTWYQIFSVIWSINSSVDSKFYRLNDFNGYYKNAKQREKCFFSDKIYKGHFGLIISSNAANDAYKQYCLSSAFLFNSSGQNYTKYTLGLLFTDESDDFGDSFLINTNVVMGYSEDYNHNGIFSNKSVQGDGSSTFWVVDKNVSGDTASSYLIKDENGYQTISQKPYWVLVKAGQGEIQMYVYIENFPYDYKRWFIEGNKYTVQFVMINGGYVNNSTNHGFFKGISWDMTSTQDNTWKYNPNLYSLNLTLNAFCKTNIEYTTLNQVNKIYYDKDGNSYDNSGEQEVVLKPTYNATYSISSPSNNMSISTSSNISQYGETYKTWGYSNYYDSYSYFNITVNISNYQIPRDKNGYSIDNGIVLSAPNIILNDTNINNNFLRKNSVTSSFKPIDFYDLFEEDLSESNIAIDHNDLTSAGSGNGYYGTIVLKYKLKFKSNAIYPAWNTRSTYTSNSSYFELYFNVDKTKKITLYIP